MFDLDGFGIDRLLNPKTAASIQGDLIESNRLRKIYSESKF